MFIPRNRNKSRITQHLSINENPDGRSQGTCLDEQASAEQGANIVRDKKGKYLKRRGAEGRGLRP
jgi:hypothetical protein